jgi:hypothetical protein
VEAEVAIDSGVVTVESLFEQAGRGGLAVGERLQRASGDGVYSNIQS